MGSIRWHFSKQCRMPGGSGVGWVIADDTGFEVCIRRGFHGITNWKDALDWVDLYVRVLDDLELFGTAADHGAH